MLNISIIGLGNVGISLAQIILNDPESIHLNIMEPGDNAKGRYLDLAHSLPLLKNKNLSLNNSELLGNADFIFHTAGICNHQGQSRLEIAKENIDLSYEIFEKIQFEKKPYIINISNPVDIISYHIQQATGLDTMKVIGTGTLLDSARYAYYLAEKNIDQTMVLGEHGNSQVALTSTLNSIPDRIEEVIENTRYAARSIRETQDYTAYGISQSAYYIFKALLNTENSIMALSVQINDHYKKLLNMDQDINLGLPCSVSKKGITILELKLHQEEIKALTESAKIIKEHT